MNTTNHTNSFFWHDLLIIAASIVFAVVLVQTDVLSTILASTKGFQFLGSFIAGLFFTSVFTTVPAIVTLGEISLMYAVVPVALFGAAGAVFGDLVIFWFIRDKFSEHLLELFEHRKKWKRLRALLRTRMLRWLSLFVGGLIVASPLPDELGISLCGFSKIKTSWFIFFSFIFNFLGIMIIGLIARAV